jgi:predicted metal-binding protein
MAIQQHTKLQPKKYRNTSTCANSASSSVDGLTIADNLPNSLKHLILNAAPPAAPTV